MFGTLPLSVSCRYARVCRTGSLRAEDSNAQMLQRSVGLPLCCPQEIKELQADTCPDFIADALEVRVEADGAENVGCMSWKTVATVCSFCLWKKITSTQRSMLTTHNTLVHDCRRTSLNGTLSSGAHQTRSLRYVCVAGQQHMVHCAASVETMTTGH